jgi:hypothetical protein
MDNHRNLMAVVYEPCGTYPASESDTDLSDRGQMINALRCAAERLGDLNFTLALGVPSGDIFIKNIEIPAGLTTKQIEQISVVEAVSNLPVPPEEICADFLKPHSVPAAHTERIEIAYCKRGLIDELGIIAEDAGVVLSIVDREIQAIHDAAIWCYNSQTDIKPVAYPLGIVVESDETTFIVSRSELDHVSYVFKRIDYAEADLNGSKESAHKELQAYCRRAGLDFEKGSPLQQLILVDDESKTDTLFDLAGVAERTIAINPLSMVNADGERPPAYGLMVAMGMSLRESV